MYEVQEPKFHKNDKSENGFNYLWICEWSVIVWDHLRKIRNHKFENENETETLRKNVVQPNDVFAVENLTMKNASHAHENNRLISKSKIRKLINLLISSLKSKELYKVKLKTASSKTSG